MQLKLTGPSFPLMSFRDVPCVPSTNTALLNAPVQLYMLGNNERTMGAARKPYHAIGGTGGSVWSYQFRKT